MTSQKAPRTEQFIKLPLDLLRSDAWRSASINARRVLDFLMIEEMRGWAKNKGENTENGRLKAPYEQLEQMGVGARYVSDAIREAEELGLVVAERRGLKVATLFTLTWLPTYDGKPPSNRWTAYRNLTLTPLPEPKKQKSASQREGRPTSQREGRSIHLPHNGKAE